MLCNPFGCWNLRSMGGSIDEQRLIERGLLRDEHETMLAWRTWTTHVWHSRCKCKYAVAVAAPRDDQLSRRFWKNRRKNNHVFPRDAEKREMARGRCQEAGQSKEKLERLETYSKCPCLILNWCIVSVSSQKTSRCLKRKGVGMAKQRWVWLVTQPSTPYPLSNDGYAW